MTEALPAGAVAPPVILALRHAARRAPEATAARIVGLLRKPAAADPDLRIDLQVLLAELLHHCGDLDAALNAAGMAGETAGALRPSDWPRLAMTLLVSADLAVCAANPAAVDACVSARHAATCAGLDPQTAVIATALQAVAVYQHGDTSKACWLLETLDESVAAGGVPHHLVTAGIAAIRGDQIGQPHRPRHSTPTPLPGGMWHPRIDPHTVGWLADRIHNARPQTPAVTT